MRVAHAMTHYNLLRLAAAKRCIKKNWALPMPLFSFLALFSLKLGEKP